MKLLELYFVLFSKLYVKFSDRENDWFYLPIIIISFLICINIYVISSIFLSVNIYYIIGLFVTFYFVLIFFLSSKRTIGKEYIRNYKFSNLILALIIFSLVIDLFCVFKILTFVRQNNMNTKTRNVFKIDSKDYELFKQ